MRLPDAAEKMHAYPHQLSGGQRQRAMIAMATACSPDVLIADEPTTALDVTVQAQILDLLVGLVEEGGSSLLLITHDLPVVATVCQRVLVLYGGHIVEEGSVDEVFRPAASPVHAGAARRDSAAGRGPARVASSRRFPARCPGWASSRRAARSATAARAPIRRARSCRRSPGNGHAAACWHPLS